MAEYTFKNLILKFTLVISGLLLLLLALLVISFFAVWLFDLNFFEMMQDSYVASILKFSFFQAFISAISVIVIAIAVSSTLNRRRSFVGRNFIIKILDFSFLIPPIVFIVAIEAFHNRGGLVNHLANLFNISFSNYLYGHFGIIIGNITIFLPPVIRIFLSRLSRVHNISWKLIAIANLSHWQIFKNIELPKILSLIKDAFLFIFVMSFAIFSTVLLLGHSPLDSNIEVAIYNSLRYDSYNEIIIIFAFLQIIICVFAILLSAKPIKISFLMELKAIDQYKIKNDSVFAMILDTIFIILLLLIIVFPLGELLINGINYKLIQIIYSVEFWESFSSSLYISSITGLLSMFVTISISYAIFYFKYKSFRPLIINKIITIVNFTIALSPFVCIVIFYSFVRSLTDGVGDLATSILLIVNVIMCLPFILGNIYKASTSFEVQELNLCNNLGIRGYNFFRKIFLGRVKRHLYVVFAISFAISWGDFSVIALLGINNELMTLPFFLFKKIETYEYGDVEAIASVMLFLSYAIFSLLREFIQREKYND